jgi:hypothetical protein
MEKTLAGGLDGGTSGDALRVQGGACVPVGVRAYFCRELYQIKA